MLDTAKKLTEGDRNSSYGDPVDNMIAFAFILEGYLKARGITEGNEMTAEDGAWVMVISKMARTCGRGLPFHSDTYVDAAAYSAMAGECAQVERG
jgi:hypothetical protein